MRPQDTARARGKRPGLLVPALLGAVLAGCASQGERRCGPGETPAVVETVYFGTAGPGGVSLTRAAWRVFMDETVTPRFPRGLSWWVAYGQWRDSEGTGVRERAHVVQIVHPETEKVTAALEEIIREYQARFAQDSVLRVHAPACMSDRPAAQ